MEQLERNVIVALERFIVVRLQGPNRNTPGLWQTVTHGVPSWDRYNQLVGEIRGLESVLEEMRKQVNRQGASEPDETVLMSRPN
jgi:hypothetical protein